MPFVHVHLDDEAPAIGSGHRIVFAAEGRRWLSLCCPWTFRTARLPLPAGRAVIVLEPVTIDRRALRRRIAAAFGRRPPARIRRMLA